MSHVTKLLHAIDQGDPHAAGQMLPLVYDELHELSRRKLDHEPTAPGCGAKYRAESPVNHN
jgi:hypothetical protein